MSSFWNNKRVFITGHTGFKGSWLALWLDMWGAKIFGYALHPSTKPSMYEVCDVEKKVSSYIGDIRCKDELKKALLSSKPEIVFHLAAQPIVRASYSDPIYTFETNIMGTAYVLEAVRTCPTVKSVVVITTDKCYENRETDYAYKESDKLGGYDPYSSSKACAELVVASYRSSFFSDCTGDVFAAGIASVRAGNVIGGGDWAEDRLIPDCVRAALAGQAVHVRNPHAIRPWQHVLEPLSGYILLAEKLYENPREYAEAWNFGPSLADCVSVGELVGRFCKGWGIKYTQENELDTSLHEAGILKLDCRKAKDTLAWEPKWSYKDAIDKVIEWTRAYKNNEYMYNKTCEQISEYIERSRM